MSTHNICFYREIRKNYPRIITKYSSLTSPFMHNTAHVLIDYTRQSSRGQIFLHWKEIKFNQLKI